MDKKTINKLLIIASAGLSIAAMIFICLHLFTDVKDNIYLYISLVNILLSNIFNIVRANLNK